MVRKSNSCSKLIALELSKITNVNINITERDEVAFYISTLQVFDPIIKNSFSEYRKKIFEKFNILGHKFDTEIDPFQDILTQAKNEK